MIAERELFEALKGVTAPSWDLKRFLAAYQEHMEEDESKHRCQPFSSLEDYMRGLRSACECITEERRNR